MDLVNKILTGGAVLSLCGALGGSCATVRHDNAADALAKNTGLSNLHYVEKRMPKLDEYLAECKPEQETNLCKHFRQEKEVLQKMYDSLMELPQITLAKNQYQEIKEKASTSIKFGFASIVSLLVSGAFLAFRTRKENE